MSIPVRDAFAELLRADPAATVAWTPDGLRSRRDLDERARAGMSRFLQLAADFDGPLPLVGGA